MAVPACIMAVSREREVGLAGSASVAGDVASHWLKPFRTLAKHK